MAVHVNDPVLAERTDASLELLAQIGQHIVLGELGMAHDLTTQLLAELNGARAEAPVFPEYTVRCRWFDDVKGDHVLERVLVTAPTRTIASLKGEQVVQELYQLGPDVAITTVIEIPGTEDE